MHEPVQQGKWARGRTLLFYVSLAMNVLVIGVVVGALLFGGRPVPRAAFDGPVPMLRALSDEERRAFTKIVRTNRGTRPERPVKSLQRGRELLAVVGAQEFDADRFAVLLAAQSRAASGRADAARAALTVVLSDMSTDERRAYAARLETSLKRAVREHRKPEEGREPVR